MSTSRNPESWMNGIIGPDTIKVDGESITTKRKHINLVGATQEDDPDNDATNVNVGGGGGSVSGDPGNIPVFDEDGTGFVPSPLNVVDGEVVASAPIELASSGGALKANGEEVINTSTGLAFGNYTNVTAFRGAGFYWARGPSDIVMACAASPLGNDHLQIRYPISGAEQQLQYASTVVDLTGESGYTVESPDNWFVYYEFTGSPTGPATIVFDDNVVNGVINVRNATDEDITVGTFGGSEETTLAPGEAAAFKYDTSASEMRCWARMGAGPIGRLQLRQVEITFASANYTLSSAEKQYSVVVCGGVMGGSPRDLTISGPGDHDVYFVDAQEIDQDVAVQPGGGGDGIIVKAGGVTAVRWKASTSEWVKFSEGPFYTSPQWFDGEVTIANLTTLNGIDIQASPRISNVVPFVAPTKAAIPDYVYTETTDDATPTDIISAISPTLADGHHSFDGQVTAIRADNGASARFDFSYSGRISSGSWTADDTATVAPKPPATTLAFAPSVATAKLVATATGIAATDYRWTIAYRHQHTVY